MKIVLFGPPDCGKRKFANSLKRKYPTFIVSSNSEDILKSIFKKDDLTPALGLFADYRTELMLAGIRSCDILYKQNKIYVNSVLDSFLYGMMISSLKLDNETITEEWLNATTFFPMMVRDSFDADLVVFFQKESQEEIDEVFNENVKFTLNLFDINAIPSTNKKQIYSEIDKLIQNDANNR